MVSPPVLVHAADGRPCIRAVAVAAARTAGRVAASITTIPVGSDVTFTEVNKRSATMVGAYGGWLQDRTWLFGAGGYWMANEDHDFQMAYGGLVSQFIARSDRRIGFGIKGGAAYGESDAMPEHSMAA